MMKRVVSEKGEAAPRRGGDGVLPIVIQFYATRSCALFFQFYARTSLVRVISEREKKGKSQYAVTGVVVAVIGLRFIRPSSSRCR